MATMASVATSITGFAFIITLAGLAFGYNIFIIGIGVLPLLLILFIFGIALGLLTTTIILRFGPSAEWIAWPIIAILTPLAGVFYPISVLPGILQTISRFLPPSYVFEGLRSVIISGQPIGDLLSGLAGALILAIIYLIIVYLLFVYNYRVVLRKGLISRFETENF